MVHRSLVNLRLDRRLLRRQGWISKEELDEEIAGLPDVAEKLAPKEEETSSGDPSPPAAETDQGGGSL